MLKLVIRALRYAAEASQFYRETLTEREAKQLREIADKMEAFVR